MQARVKPRKQQSTNRRGLTHDNGVIEEFRSPGPSVSRSGLTLWGPDVWRCARVVSGRSSPQSASDDAPSSPRAALGASDSSANDASSRLLDPSFVAGALEAAIGISGGTEIDDGFCFIIHYRQPASPDTIVLLCLSRAHDRDRRLKMPA
jgi:hypothetical protein